MSTDDGVDLVPGATAYTLILWSVVVAAVSLVAGFLLLLIGVTGPLRPTAAYVSLGAAAVAGVVFVVCVAVLVTGVRRSRDERRHGYTTLPGIAAQDRSFTYVHRSTHEVLARPGQPRGSNGRGLEPNPSATMVPGRSAGSHLVVAAWCWLLIMLCLPVIAMESTLPGDVRVWVGGAVVAVVALIVVGGVEYYRSMRTADREAGAGYATLAGRAVDNPALTYRDRRTFEVRALPGEPVPVGKRLRPRQQPGATSRWSVGSGRW